MSDQTESSKLKVRYESSSAMYANQVVLSANAEDLVLDFSSGAVPDPNTGETVLPIHTRIAVSWAGAARLRALLDKALQRREDGATGKKAK